MRLLNASRGEGTGAARGSGAPPGLRRFCWALSQDLRPGLFSRVPPGPSYNPPSDPGPNYGGCARTKLQIASDLSAAGRRPALTEWAGPEVRAPLRGLGVFVGRFPRTCVLGYFRGSLRDQVTTLPLLRDQIAAAAPGPSYGGCARTKLQIACDRSAAGRRPRLLEQVRPEVLPPLRA